MKNIQVAVLEAGETELKILPEFNHSLENMQQVVEGYLQALSIDQSEGKEITMWFNEEGKLIDLPINLGLISGGRLVDIVTGNILFTGTNHEGETVGLSNDEINKIKRILKGPVNVNSIGMIPNSMEI